MPQTWRVKQKFCYFQQSISFFKSDKLKQIILGFMLGDLEEALAQVRDKGNNYPVGTKLKPRPNYLKD